MGSADVVDFEVQDATTRDVVGVMVLWKLGKHCTSLRDHVGRVRCAHVVVRLGVQ